MFQIHLTFSPVIVNYYLHAFSSNSLFILYNVDRHLSSVYFWLLGLQCHKHPCPCRLVDIKYALGYILWLGINEF